MAADNKSFTVHWNGPKAGNDGYIRNYTLTGAFTTDGLGLEYVNLEYDEYNPEYQEHNGPYKYVMDKVDSDGILRFKSA